jgi:PAS domain S-box-containing protein/diguanylate cyclase (GGDEF)-like protein
MAMTQRPDIPELPDPEIFRTVLDSLRTGVYVVDRQRKILFWNEGAEKITGYHRHDVVGHASRDNILAQCDDKGCMLCGAVCPLTEAIIQGKPTEAQVYLHHKAGHRVPVRLRVGPIRDRHGSIVATAASFEEERWEGEPNIHANSLAAHGCLDLTTGVPNHAFTQSHLRENLAFFEEYHLPFGILCIEVEDMEHLKATHGREAVDVMLHVVAQTMKHTLRPDGFLGRWAETQFLAIVTNCGRTELERLAQSVQKMGSCSGIQWWDDLLSVNVTVGWSMVQLGDSMESLLGRASGCFSKNSVKSAAAGSGAQAET